MLRAPAWSCFRFPPRRPRPGPALSKPCPAAPGGARARACAGGGGWGRIASEIPRRGSRARPRPGPQLPPGRPGSAMIKAILIFNNHGKPRLSKFYQPYSEDTQQQIIRETFHLVSKRDENVCNFLEGGLLIGGSDNKLIYRHYATLYFVFCVDSSESELGILDLIQVFVETLDKCFENVCELDLIFHVDKASHCCGLSRCGAQAPDTQAQWPWLTGPTALRHVGSSRTGARTRVPCVGRRTLNHCATREAPKFF
ncbi:AP-3 complex subunit sigma-1 isoform X3 [Pseudorca crassidens]|uniref:AP-3 complex subunit sigma-1 isoform X3 n=1 Tax=Pseudorca crassidens TaxID=82174 RepID=UPI00352F5EDD